jgi:hypothetical protein
MGELCIEHEASAKTPSRLRLEHVKTAAALVFAASVAGLIRSRA